MAALINRQIKGFFIKKMVQKYAKFKNLCTQIKLPNGGIAWRGI